MTMHTETIHIVLAGGGTAGHVNPLLAVADAIRAIEPQSQISVIGTSVGLERDLVPQAGYELDTIAKVPFPRRPNAAALRFPRDWHRETRKVRDILRRRQAKVVAGFGGYASAPVYSCAHRLGLPVVIHEQNARSGMANRLGSRWATFIGTAYDGTGLKTGRGGEIKRVGLPLRPQIAALCASLERDRGETRRACAARLGLDPERPIVVVTGGSLGAANLNRAVAGAAAQLLPHTQIVHLTGRGKLDEVRDLVSSAVGPQALSDLHVGEAGESVVVNSAGTASTARTASTAVATGDAGTTPASAHDGDYRVAEYLERIDLAFGCADLVICRSGAGSVSELAALGLPAVYVPLPIGNGEQRFNAQPVVDAGGGLMVDDHDFTTSWVREHVAGLLADHARLDAMGRATWGYGIRDAAEVMARRVLAIARSAASPRA